MSAHPLELTLRYVLIAAVIVGSTLLVLNEALGQQTANNKPPEQSDPFKSLRLFIGRWEGDSQGKPGVGKMEREYVFVLRDRFIRASNMAV